MKNIYRVATYKMVFGLLGFSAIVTEIATLIERGFFAPENFFSYFTILSNIFAASIFIVSALMVMGGLKMKVLVMLRGAATLYMIVTGLVFAVLLAGIEGATLTAVPWDNIVLHYIIPLAVVGDWLIDPPKKRIDFRKALVWLIFPIIYVVYSLVRGAMVGWYPYPFLNPATNGYIGIALTSVAIAVLGLILVFILTRIPKK